MKYIKFLYLLLALISCQNEKRLEHSSEVSSKTVYIRKTSDGFSLYRNGEPYYIKGVGGYTHLKKLKEMGGNSIRVWDTNDAERILAQAQENGLTVMLGIWIVREREGFNYFDNDAVNQLKKRIKADVLRYRNHPALLVWCLGNELEGGIANARAWKIVNEIAVMIHELDPNHPITMAVNGLSPNVIRTIKKNCPAINLLSFNVYGNLPHLSEILLKADWGGPYIISEYSSQGYWEVPLTSWQAPIELNSSRKADFIGKIYKKYILKHPPNCLGSYAFFWGAKQECTPTWFSILDGEGRKSAIADMLQYMWTAQWPANRAPSIIDISLSDKNKVPVYELYPEEIYNVNIKAKDLENDSLLLQWEVLPESNWAELDGGVDKEVKPLPVNNVLLDNRTATVRIKCPLEPGPYRIFVYVYDKKGSFGSANIAFLAGENKKSIISNGMNGILEFQ